MFQAQWFTPSPTSDLSSTSTALSFRLMRLALPLLHRLGRVPFVAFRQAPDLDRAIEEALQPYGGGRVRCVQEPVYAGANGALKIAYDMPAEAWEQLR